MNFNPPSGWNFRPLGQCIDLVIDHRGKTPKKLGSDWVKEGVPTISAKNVNGGKLVAKESIRYVPHDIYKKWMKEDVQKGDCFLVSEGATLGECLYWDEKYPVVLGQRIFCIRANPEILNPRYLYAYMASHGFQHEITGRATGSSVSGLRQTEVLQLQVLLPPLNEQAVIGNTLFNINKKIDINHQINQTLEQMAQTLFKSWFVDFDPVKAKIAALEAGGGEEDALLTAMQVIAGDTQECTNTAEGSAPEAATGDKLARLQAEQPQQYAELRATAELFPSAMQDSELDEIPEGWNVLNLEDLCTTITKGTTPKKSEIAESTDPASIYFIKVKDIKSTGEIVQEGLEIIPSSVNRKALKRSILETGDLLFSIAGTIGRVAIVDSNLAGSNTNQAVGIIRLKEPGRHLSLVWQLLISVRTHNEIRSKVVQGVQANASLKNLRDIQVLLPCNHILEIAISQLDALLQQIASNRAQSRNLKEMRDTLLPRLLSGELPLSGAESELAGIEEAADV